MDYIHRWDLYVCQMRAFFHILIASESSRLYKERTKILNYRNENATPCQRYSGCVGCDENRANRHTGNNGCSCNANTHNTSNCNTNSCNISSRAREERGNRCGCRAQMNYNRGASSRSTNRRGCGESCVCGSDNGYVEREAPIAMVYSPMQRWKDLYDPHTALGNGTIFKELDLPFYPTPCRRKENGQCQCR